jgi:hypothetical protein
VGLEGALGTASISAGEALSHNRAEGDPRTPASCSMPQDTSSKSWFAPSQGVLPPASKAADDLHYGLPSDTVVRIKHALQADVDFVIRQKKENAAQWMGQFLASVDHNRERRVAACLRSAPPWLLHLAFFVTLGKTLGTPARKRVKSAGCLGCS